MEYLIKNLLPPNILETISSEASLTATIIGSLLFSIAVIYILAPRIERIEADKYLYISTVPWLVTAGGLSAFYSSASTEIVLNSFIFTALSASLITALHIGKKIEKKKHLDKSYIVLFTGIIVSIPVFSLLDLQTYSVILQTATHIAYWLIPLITVSYLLRNRLRPYLVVPVITHFMDASSTVVALSKGAVEKQFIARFFIESLGPHGIFILKSISIIPIVYIINRETEGKEKIFYLYIITALGLVITVRNTLLTATGL